MKRAEGRQRAEKYRNRPAINAKTEKLTSIIVSGSVIDTSIMLGDLCQVVDQSQGMCISCFAVCLESRNYIFR